jgi:hypothetical protein
MPTFGGISYICRRINIFIYIHKTETVIDISCFSKRAHLCTGACFGLLGPVRGHTYPAGRRGYIKLVRVFLGGWLAQYPGENLVG